MAVSFVLMMVLTRRSGQEVGVFRTLTTFLLIAETFPLLGMQRWLSIQIGTDLNRRGVIFASAMVWAACTAVPLAVAYIGIAMSGLYDVHVARGMMWIAAAALPSSALLVEQYALVGIGRTGRVGLLNLGENVIRSGAGIVLILAKFDVLAVIAVFAFVRWATAIIGFRMICGEIGRLDWRRPFAELVELRTVVPRFAGVMVCALAVRNVALVILPSLSSTTQTGFFAVSFQLADLAMLAPTVLALSSTFAMSRDASSSRAQLRRTMVAMVTVLSVMLFPVSALVTALSKPVLAFLFGSRVLAAAPALQLMMLTTPLVAVDQVLSQGMVSSQRYSDDLIAISLSALAMTVLTVTLGKEWGAAGAATSFLASMSLSVVARLWLMRDLRLTGVFIHAAWRSGIAALVSGAVTAWCAVEVFHTQDDRWLLLWVIPGIVLYGAVLSGVGGATKRARRRMSGLISHKEF